MKTEPVSTPVADFPGEAVAELPDDTVTELVGDLRLAVMRMRRRLVHERHPDNDLSVPAMGVLAMLRRHGDLTIGELAALEKVRPPSTSRMVTRLEERGLVRRVPHATDGRVMQIHLTEEGSQVLAADRGRRDAWLARRLDGLDDADRDALRRAAAILLHLAQEE